MFRALLIPILIAGVLACPLRCMSCAAGAAERDGSVVASCSCCHTEQSGPPTSSDDQSDNECSCPNCICEGATFQPGPQLADGAIQSTSDGRWLMTVNEHVPGIIAQHRLQVIALGHHFSGARAALIAHQSWRI